MENLGTALKTIIARFQEMKSNPTEILSLDGEEASLNKVDKALATIGISLKDASGQFRDLDEVIFELADKDDIVTITKRINGGLTNISDRTKILNLAKNTLKMEK